jgi:hypothetical protein
MPGQQHKLFIPPQVLLRKTVGLVQGQGKIYSVQILIPLLVRKNIVLVICHFKKVCNLSWNQKIKGSVSMDFLNLDFKDVSNPD